MNNETNPTYFLKSFILPVRLERVCTENTARNTFVIKQQDDKYLLKSDFHLLMDESFLDYYLRAPTIP